MKYNVKWKCHNCGHVNKWKWSKFDADTLTYPAANMVCDQCNETSVMEFKLKTKTVEKTWYEAK